MKKETKITFSRGLSKDIWLDVYTDSNTCWHFKLAPYEEKAIEQLKLLDKTFIEKKK